MSTATPQSLRRILFSLGANLGNREEYLREAVSALREFLHDVRVSSFYETAPVGYIHQPAFLNMCLIGSTDKQLLDVVLRCKDIEKKIGRIQRERWHEREIDIDVICAEKDVRGDEEMCSGEITVPHPRAFSRRFVLEPACEIAEDMLYQQRPLGYWLSVCEDTSNVIKL